MVQLMLMMLINVVDDDAAAAADDDDDGEDDDGDGDGDDDGDDDDGDDDDGDDDDGDDDDGDDDDDERTMMMMMLRRMMLRRKADPKTGKQTLREPARSKCTWSHFVWKFRGQLAEDTSGDIVLCEPAQSKCTWSHFVWKFTGQVPDADPATPVFFGTRELRAARGCTCIARYCSSKLDARRPFCASLRSQNAYGHFTRAILCGNLQGVSRTRMRTPRLNTGP